jgi:hypoxanthine phosphoribosyltransferase
MSANNAAGVSTEALEVETLFDPAALQKRVAELGQRIGEEIGDEDPIVVGLLGGSLVFLVDLVRAVERPIRFELIQVASGEDSGVIRIEYPIPVDIAGQSVLVVKDVVTSGITEPYLEQQLRDHGAGRVRFAALIDIPDARKTDFVPDYSAFTIPPRGTLVGYGLKHQGRYGNLSGVGRIKGTG